MVQSRSSFNKSKLSSAIELQFPRNVWAQQLWRKDLRHEMTD